MGLLRMSIEEATLVAIENDLLGRLEKRQGEGGVRRESRRTPPSPWRFSSLPSRSFSIATRVASSIDILSNPMVGAEGSSRSGAELGARRLCQGAQPMR